MAVPPRDHHKENVSVYSCFVDYLKAFDFVWHERLFYKLVSWSIACSLACVDLLQVDLLASGASLQFRRRSRRPRATKSQEVLRHMKSDEGLFWKSIACVESVSVWFRSKERPRIGLLGFGCARNETRAKKWAFFSRGLWLSLVGTRCKHHIVVPR